MVPFVLPAVLAGLLGLVAHNADDYLPALRLLFLGSAGLGYLGMAWFLWRKASGFTRWALIVAMLAALRIWYAPIVATSVLLAAWLDWGARKAGAANLSGPVHYALACFVAMLSGMAALLVVASVTRIKSVRSVVVLLATIGMGVLAFWHPEDRAPLPHPFDDAAPAPGATGPEYADVVEDGDRTVYVRLLAGAGAARHFLSPRSGWGGIVREEQLAQFRDRPDASLRARTSALERALVRARARLRTSPRSPPASSGRPRPGRSGTRR